MNDNIRQAEDFRASIVAKVSENPHLFSLEPLQAVDAAYMDGPWSVAIRVRDQPPLAIAAEIRIVSTMAEDALFGRICFKGRGVLTPGEFRVKNLLTCCIGIANYTLGLILLKPDKKERDPFTRRIEEMGTSAEQVFRTLPARNVPSLIPHNRSVNALRDHASLLVAYREKLLRSTYTKEKLKVIDAMRTIILAYSSEPHPT